MDRAKFPGPRARQNRPWTRDTSIHCVGIYIAGFIRFLVLPVGMAFGPLILVTLYSKNDIWDKQPLDLLQLFCNIPTYVNRDTWAFFGGTEQRRPLDRYLPQELVRLACLWFFSLPLRVRNKLYFWQKNHPGLPAKYIYLLRPAGSIQPNCSDEVAVNIIRGLGWPTAAAAQLATMWQGASSHHPLGMSATDPRFALIFGIC